MQGIAVIRHALDAALVSLPGSSPANGHSFRPIVSMISVSPSHLPTDSPIQVRSRSRECARPSVGLHERSACIHKAPRCFRASESIAGIGRQYDPRNPTGRQSACGHRGGDPCPLPIKNSFLRPKQFGIRLGSNLVGVGNRCHRVPSCEKTQVPPDAGEVRLAIGCSSHGLRRRCEGNTAAKNKPGNNISWPDLLPDSVLREFFSSPRKFDGSLDEPIC